MSGKPYATSGWALGLVVLALGAARMVAQSPVVMMTSQQDLQATAVLFLHHRNAGPCWNYVEHLLGKIALDVGHPVRGISGVVDDPLPQHSGKPG